MRHIIIEHNSACDGYEASTKAWVADDLTGAALDAALAEVHAAYLAHLRALPAELGPEPTPALGVEWSKQRDRTVGEVLDEQDLRRVRRREWERARSARARSFADFLYTDPRFGAEDPDAESTSLDWGHLHGGLPVKFN